MLPLLLEEVEPRLVRSVVNDALEDFKVSEELERAMFFSGTFPTTVGYLTECYLSNGEPVLKPSDLKKLGSIITRHYLNQGP